MKSLVAWSPFQEFDVFDRRLRRMFGDIGLLPTIPAADVYETKDEFVLELEVPGYEEKELEIETSDHTVVVKGHRAATMEKEEKVFRLHERLETEFERRFQLPPEADTTHMKAVFTKGVLEVHAPKTPDAKPRKIAIGKG